MRKRHKTQYPGIWYRLVNEDRPDGPRRYIVGYTDANGDWHTETLPLGSTLEDARLRRGKLAQQRKVIVPTKKTVGELLDEYIEARRSSLKPKTLEVYEWGAGVVKKYINRRKVRDLTANDCATMIRKMQEDGLSKASVTKALTPLQGALKVAVREGWVQTNPLSLLLSHERPNGSSKRMRVLSSDEIHKLLKAASSDRWRILFATLIFTGLRIGEALALRWEDVNGTIRVRGGKTKAAEREVMLVPSLANELRKLRLAQPPGTEYVFANKNGSPVSRREALRALRAAEKRAGLTDYTLHELRHTFASILIAQGENVVLVSHQLGHKDPAVTLKIYAHLFDEQENVERAKGRLQAAFGVVL